MKALAKITSIILLLAFSIGAKAQSGDYDVFVPIAKYISHGDAERLSAWFADNLEVTVLTETNDSSKNQVRQILKSFFDSHTPRSFDITHTAGRSNMKYALGVLNAGGEEYNVTIFVCCSPTGYKIQQIKIDRPIR